MLPEDFFNYFALTSQISKKSTKLTEKSKKFLFIRYYKILQLQRCIKYQGVKIWNEIQIQIQNIFYNVFKYEFKRYLLKAYINI